ncbi:hypothetical protein BH11BAC6_BH11BAC6_04280 [soil metagenome]
MFLTFSSISRDIGIDITNTVRTKYYYKDTHIAFALRAGTGLGIDIPFGRKKKFAAIIKASYLYGSNARYYAHPSVNNTQITLYPQESRTTMVLAEAGFRYGLFKKK